METAYLTHKRGPYAAAFTWSIAEMSQQFAPGPARVRIAASRIVMGVKVR